MMTSIKLRLMVLLIVVTMFTSHQAWGEQDCHEDKETILMVCYDSIEINGDYVPPTNICRRAVEKYDMACICRILKPGEEVVISAFKLVRLARDCGKTLPIRSKCGSKDLMLFKYIFYSIILERE